MLLWVGRRAIDAARVPVSTHERHPLDVSCSAARGELGLHAGSPPKRTRRKSEAVTRRWFATVAGLVVSVATLTRRELFRDAKMGNVFLGPSR